MRTIKYNHADEYNSLLYFADVDEVDHYLDVIEHPKDLDWACALDLLGVEKSPQRSSSDYGSNGMFDHLFSRGFDEPLA